MGQRTIRGFEELQPSRAGYGAQIFTYPREAERPRSEVGASVALIGKRDQGANLAENFFPEATCCQRAIRSNVFPNSDDVLRGKRMKSEATLSIH
jgi:hypothetical protein